MTVEELREKGLILFECLSGSHLFGTDREDSDMDYRGIFILPKELLYKNEYIPQINDSKGDTTYYELSRFMELLLECKPNVIEMLYAPEDKIIYKNPLLDGIFSNRDSYIQKGFGKATIGFAESQIHKATGLNKKLNWEKDDMKRKGVLDFCYVPYKQGSANVVNWLTARGLKQEYCGLVNLNNMRDAHGVFYDFWQHVEFERLSLWQSLKFLRFLKNSFKPKKVTHVTYLEVLKNYKFYIKNYKNLKFKGIVRFTEASNDIALCEIPKGIDPFTTMMFNKDGYSVHCKRYAEFEKYLAERNVARYNDVKGHNQKIDGKNLLHMMRTLKMCVEYFETGKMNIDRRNIDREFLLSIRKGEMNLEEIISQGKAMIEKISQLNSEKEYKPLEIDKILDIVIEIRENFYNNGLHI